MRKNSFSLKNNLILNNDGARFCEALDNCVNFFFAYQFKLKVPVIYKKYYISKFKKKLLMIHTAIHCSVIQHTYR